MVRPDRVELPTFWFVARPSSVSSLLYNEYSRIKLCFRYHKHACGWAIGWAVSPTFWSPHRESCPPRRYRALLRSSILDTSSSVSSQIAGMRLHRRLYSGHARTPATSRKGGRILYPCDTNEHPT